MRVIKRPVFWLRAVVAMTVLSVATASDCSNPHDSQFEFEKTAVVLMSINAEKLARDLNMKLVYRRKTKQNDSPSSREKYHDTDLENELEITAGETTKFYAVVKQNKPPVEGNTEYADCIMLYNGQAVVAAKRATVQTTVNQCEGEISEGAQSQLDVDFAIVERFFIDDDFRINDPREILIIKSEFMKNIKLLTKLVRDGKCVAKQQPRDKDSTQYYICKRRAFKIIPWHDNERILILKSSKEWIAKVLFPNSQPFEDVPHIELPLRQNFGWKQWKFRSDAECKIPQEISIGEATGTRPPVIVKPYRQPDRSALFYYPYDSAVYDTQARHTRLSLFNPVLEEHGNREICLKLDNSSVKLELIGDRDEREHSKASEVMSASALKELKKSLEEWGLGKRSNVWVSTEFSSRVRVSPQPTDGGNSIILTGIPWNRIQIIGKVNEIDEDLPLEGWKLVEENARGGKSIDLDRDGSVASYRVRNLLSQKATFNLKAPTNLNHVHYQSEKISFVPNDLNNKVGVTRKKVFIESSPVNLTLKPSLIHGIVPILEVELYDGTLIKVIGEAGSGDFMKNTIVVRSRNLESCPEGSRETKRNHHKAYFRTCSWGSEGNEPSYEIKVKDLNTTTPVGLWDMTRVRLYNNPKKLEEFRRFWSTTGSNSFKERRAAFHELFAPEKYGVVLGARQDDVVIGRWQVNANLCEVAELQKSPVSDFFRIAKHRTNFEVIIEGQHWQSLEDLNSRVRPQAPTHAYILLIFDDFDRPRGNTRKQQKGFNGNDSLLDLLDRRSGSSGVRFDDLEKFQSLWSEESDGILDFLSDIGVKMVTFYVTYTENNKRKFVSIDESIDTEDKWGFKKLRGRLLDSRDKFHRPRKREYLPGVQKDASHLALEFQLEMAEKCDFHPFSYLFILTPMHHEASVQVTPADQGPSVLKDCRIEGIFRDGSSMKQLFKDCVP